VVRFEAEFLVLDTKLDSGREMFGLGLVRELGVDVSTFPGRVEIQDAPELLSLAFQVDGRHGRILSGTREV
jgi:hypothetical protein